MWVVIKTSQMSRGTNSAFCNTGHLKVVEALIQRHANLKAADRNGKTALDLAKDDSIRAALEAALQQLEGRQKADKQAKQVELLTNVKRSRTGNAYLQLKAVRTESRAAGQARDDGCSALHVRAA